MKMKSNELAFVCGRDVDKKEPNHIINECNYTCK